MKKRFLILFLTILTLLCLCSCDKSDTISLPTQLPNSSSTFSIQFIDVGQGDSALVECDGRYMLIDGGDKSARDKVYSVLESKEIQHLDILAMSHLHEDHIGGLVKALTYASKIDKVIANSTYSDTKIFQDVNSELGTNGASISVPHEGDKFKLGSAEVEVIDVSNESENDSLVLMITYGKNKFLFTGDIEDKAQKRITDKFENKDDKAYKIDLMKIPHHGSKEPSLYRFVRTFMPDYSIISVGDNNYGHPEKETLELLEQADSKIFRTDSNGDIIVKSDEKEISITTSKATPHN